MATNFNEGTKLTPEQIHWELKKPFSQREVKTRPGPGGKRLSYIDSRAVMRRLDKVVGAHNWQDQYQHMGANRLECSLTIKYGDEWITKSDGAGETDIEGEKGVFADAFKRAAVKHGIGQYLYEDGGENWTPEQYEAKVPRPKGPPTKPEEL